MVNMPQFIFQQLSGDFCKKVGRAKTHSKSPTPSPSTPLSPVMLQTCESRYKGILLVIPLQRAEVSSSPRFWAPFLEGREVVYFSFPTSLQGSFTEVMPELSLLHQEKPYRVHGSPWLCPSVWDGVQGPQGTGEGVPCQAAVLILDGRLWAPSSTRMLCPLWGRRPHGGPQDLPPSALSFLRPFFLLFHPSTHPGSAEHPRWLAEGPVLALGTDSFEEMEKREQGEKMVVGSTLPTQLLPERGWTLSQPAEKVLRGPWVPRGPSSAEPASEAAGRGLGAPQPPFPHVSKRCNKGIPGWLSGLAPPSAQGMILESWD